jgi:hypothetical protein
MFSRFLTTYGPSCCQGRIDRRDVRGVRVHELDAAVFVSRQQQRESNELTDSRIGRFGRVLNMKWKEWLDRWRMAECWPLTATVRPKLLVFFEHQRDAEANQMAAFPARDRDAFMEHWAKILADEAVLQKALPNAKITR